MRKFFIFFLILSIGKVCGQDNFKRGYIITNDKDTVTGWIDFRTDAQNMSICKYKADETAEVISYLPGQIYGYRFYQEGKFYVSREITINDSQRLVFLEYLVQGIINLYYYVSVPDSGQDIAYYFFEDETGKMNMITKKPDKLITDDRGRTLKHEDFAYKGMIRYLFQNQKSISKEADKIKFEPKSMINVAKEYHEQVCTTGEECIVFETTEDKAYTRFKFSVYGGALLFIDRQGELESLLIPAIGGRININVPRLNENLSFQADLMIAKVHERFDKMSYHVLLPPQLGVKYVLGNHKIRPAFGAGISISPGTMPYLSLGLNYQVNKKQAVFFDAEWISARKLYDSEFNTKIFYFKLGYTF